VNWVENERGVSYVFGENIVEEFLNEFDFDLICRAHQVFLLDILSLICFR